MIVEPRCFVPWTACSTAGWMIFFGPTTNAMPLGRATREDFESLLAETTGEDLTPLIRDYLDTYILN